MKNPHKKTGIFAVSATAALGSIFLWSPVISSYADTSAESDVNLSIQAVMSLSLDANSLNLNTTTNRFVSGVINATASTNSQYGYTLTLEDNDSNTNLVHTDASISDVFSSDFENSKTSAKMDNNSWGFSLNGLDYFKVPVNGSPVALKRTSEPMTVSSETTPVTFGVKTGDIMSGTYVDTVVFTMYTNGQDKEPDTGANPTDACVITDTIHDITNMQQMNKCVCQNTTTPANTATIFDWDGSHHGDTNYVPRTSLIDVRDGNSYLVSKLADGNCWMSQNLGFDLTEGVALTSETSDLNTKSSWTPIRSTFTVKPTTRTWPTNDKTASLSEYSYHPIPGEDYFRDGRTMDGVPTGEGKEYDWEKAGNYYNWYAATAGSGTYDGVISGSVEDSICPKGWRLPKGDRTARSYPYLFSKYVLSSMQNEMLSAPFNFVLAGNYLYYSQMRAQESGALYWTSEASSRKAARSLRAWDVGVQTDNTNDKARGLSVRCVAR